jgi:hypothetical protein
VTSPTLLKPQLTVTDPTALMLWIEDKVRSRNTESAVLFAEVLVLKRQEAEADQAFFGGPHTYGREMGWLGRVEWHWRGERRQGWGVRRAPLTLPQPSVNLRTPRGELWLSWMQGRWLAHSRKSRAQLEAVRASCWLGITEAHVTELVHLGALRSTRLDHVLAFRRRWQLRQG